jgi:hypothetical protein
MMGLYLGLCTDVECASCEACVWGSVHICAHISAALHTLLDECVGRGGGISGSRGKMEGVYLSRELTYSTLPLLCITLCCYRCGTCS